MAAIHTSEVSLGKTLNPFRLVPTLRFDLSLEGGNQKMNFSSQKSMEDHKKSSSQKIGYDRTDKTFHSNTDRVPKQSSLDFRFELSLAESRAC